MDTAYVYDPIYLEHDLPSHPENARRLKRILSTLEDEGVLARLRLLEPRPATAEELQRVHTPRHIERVQRKAQAGGGNLDPDTYVSPRSFDAALMAAGGGVRAVEAVLAGDVVNCFALVRPPGHHATATRAMGFCLFNNIAIAARYAQSLGYEKVMIIDFDVHHGNGTQDTFYEDDTVFYFSSHQAFAYPGTGAEAHKGAGAGEGFTANYLVMPDSGDHELLDIYENDLPQYIDRFDPDIILVSAGYDLHESDPLAQLNVTTEGIAKIVRLILDSADVPFVFFLEGGYDVDALGENVKVTLEVMMK